MLKYIIFFWLVWNLFLKSDKENSLIKNDLNQVKNKLGSITEYVKEIKSLTNNINEIIPLFKDIYTAIKA